MAVGTELTLISLAVEFLFSFSAWLRHSGVGGSREGNELVL